MKETIESFRKDMLQAIDELPKEADIKKACKDAFNKGGILTEDSFEKATKEDLENVRDSILKALEDLPKEEVYKKAFEESFIENKIINEDSFSEKISLKYQLKKFFRKIFEK